MIKESVAIPEGKITSEGLVEWTKRLGVKLRIGNIFNTEVTKDSIKHFVDGIGDTNPLWYDEKHASETSYERLPAPPSWLYSVFPGGVLQGLPGVHAFRAGDRWTFHRPLRIGDKIKPECIFAGFDLRRSKFAGKTAFEYRDSRYYNQADELIAQTYSWVIRTERRAAREKGKYSKYTLPHPWTDEELKKIEEEVLSTRPRGSEPRYWEDAQVGEEIPTLVKGPLGMTDIVAYCVGADPVGVKSTRTALELYRRHPAWAIRDPSTFALEPMYAVHYNTAVANAVGVPYPYDVGPQRQSWLLQLLTDYIGNEGWIKKSYAELKKFFYYSDVLWLKGKIVNKFLSEDHEPCIDIEAHAINQRGEYLMPSHSTIVLPSREYDYWPVKARLSGKIGVK